MSSNAGVIAFIAENEALKADNKRLREALDNICSWTQSGFVHNKHPTILEARELLKQHEYTSDIVKK